MKKLIICLLCISIFFIDIYFETNFPKIRFVSIKSNKLPVGKNIKILQISDVHNKKFPRENRSLLKKIEKIKPDMIVITGDLIDGKTKNFENVYSFVEQLVKINANTYFVSGNHEWRNENMKSFMNGIKERNLIILNNANTIFLKEKNSINICGIDDPYSNHEDAYKAFEKIDQGNFTVLLSHSPDIIMKEKKLPADLILCGHTHGGQVRLPFIGAIVAPGQGLFPKYDKGLFKVWEDTILYIDSGLGTSVWPLRFFNWSQMSLITIEGQR